MPPRRPDLQATAVAASGAGAAAMAAAAGVCCVPILAPALVSVLGVSGAIWAAGFKPYAWWILAVSGLLLAYGFHVLYLRRPATDSCEIGQRQLVPRLMIWLALVVWLLALALNIADATAVFAQEPPGYEVLDADLEPFRSRFNAESQTVRAVLVVGPT